MKTVHFLTLVLLACVGCHSDNVCYHDDNDLSGSILGEWLPMCISIDRISEVECFKLDPTLPPDYSEGKLSFTNDGRTVTFFSSGNVHSNYSLSSDKRQLFVTDSIGSVDTLGVLFLDDEHLVLVFPANPPKDTTAFSTSFLYKRK